MTVERAESVLFGDQKMTLIGPEIRPGDKAPNFTVLATDMSEATLANDSGKVRVLLSIPSLDTGICDAETKRFNEETANLGDVAIYAISVDLPTAQTRWCAANGVEAVKVFSDHRTLSFGQAYGTHIKELRQLSRAVFLVDQEDVVRYVEYVPSIGEHPNYEAALSATKNL